MIASFAALMTAHFGHWWTSLLYLAPVVIVVAWLTFTQWRENRKRDD